MDKMRLSIDMDETLYALRVLGQRQARGLDINIEDLQCQSEDLDQLRI